MQRSDYLRASDYGFAVAYHAAATNDTTAICQHASLLPYNEQSCYYNGAACGLEAYTSDYPTRSKQHA